MRTNMPTCRHTNKPTCKHADKQTYMQTCRQTNLHADVNYTETYRHTHDKAIIQCKYNSTLRPPTENTVKYDCTLRALFRKRRKIRSCKRWYPKALFRKQRKIRLYPKALFRKHCKIRLCPKALFRKHRKIRLYPKALCRKHRKYDCPLRPASETP